jgi:ADP-heptose:LPS heptosyltransferase
MNVDTMRSIDFYVGVPLCFVATWWLRLTNLIFSKPATAPKRVMFLQLSEMGSAIIGDASIRWARAQGLDVYYAIFARNAASLRMVGTIAAENTFLIREDNFQTLAFDSLRLLLWARKNKIDAVIDFELFSRFSALLTAFSGARERVGFHKFHAEGLYRGETLTRRVSYNPHIHIAKNFMALVKSLMSTENDVPFYKGEIRDDEIQPVKVKITSDAVARVRSALKEITPADEKTKWVIFNCAGGEFLPQRRWPQMYYAKLAQMILDKHPEVTILLTGSPSEFGEVDPIRVLSSRARCLNFAGRVKFEDLTALYSISNLMLSNDSGPAHFASLTDIPTYVFFGPETPKLYGSLGQFTALYANYACSPCVSAFNHRKTACTDNKCLQHITPEHVYKTIESQLRSS